MKRQRPGIRGKTLVVIAVQSQKKKKARITNLSIKEKKKIICWMV